MTALLLQNLEAVSERLALTLLLAMFAATLLVVVIVFTAFAVGPQRLRDLTVLLLTPDD